MAMRGGGRPYEIPVRYAHTHPVPHYFPLTLTPDITSNKNSKPTTQEIMAAAPAPSAVPCLQAPAHSKCKQPMMALMGTHT